MTAPRAPRRAKISVSPEVEPMAPSAGPAASRTAGMGNRFLVLVVLMVVGTVGIASWSLRSKASDAPPVVPEPKQEEPKTPTAEELLTQTVNAVGQLMILPMDEVPVLTTEENGDATLVFAKAAMTVTYRPSTNQIVNVGDVPKPEPAKPITVEVRNGTQTRGLAKTLSDALAKDDVNHLFTLLKPATASRADYASTTIVDVSGGVASAEALKMLTDRFKATVVTALPKGEAPTEAHIVIIAGGE